MSKIKESALELIGGTPIMKLNGYAKKAGVTDAVIGKTGVFKPSRFCKRPCCIIHD